MEEFILTDTDIFYGRVPFNSMGQKIAVIRGLFNQLSLCSIWKSLCKTLVKWPSLLTSLRFLLH